MSGTTLHSFMVYAPDYTDEGVLERRLKVPQQHLTEAEVLVKSGDYKIGGGFLSPDGLEVANPTSKLIGSMLVVRAQNLAEAKKKVEADIYYTASVWDKERLVVLPFLQAPFTE